MLTVSQTSNSSDVDEDQYLNGMGSAVVISIKPKKVTRRNRLINHIKNNIAAYLIVVALAVTILVVIQVKNDYQTTITQTIAQNNSLKEFLKSSQNTSDNINVKNTNMFLDKVQSKNSETTLAKNLEAKQLPVKTQLVSSDKKSNTNLKSDTKLASQQKQAPKSPPGQSKQPPILPQRGGRPVAGIAQFQRVNAQKWLALKDQNIYQDTKLAKQQRTYYQNKYNMSIYPQLPICIVIPSHNNVKDDRHLKNIKSVVMQEYTNYHIVFIDDASTDGTGDQIQSFMAEQKKIPKERYVVIKNKQQKRAMPNLRRAATEFCQPQDIFIIVDGDDELLGRQVLKLFNAIFQSKKAWFVYSNFLNIRGSVGYSRAFPQSTVIGNKYRSYPFVTSHLRAFYTQLFLNINQTDLKDDAGEYLKAANDVAICIPILQMSHQKVYYLQELTYYYNSNTGQNNHQVRLKQQKYNDKMLRKRKSYAPLQQLQFKSRNKNKTVTQNSLSVPPTENTNRSSDLQTTNNNK